MNTSNQTPGEYQKAHVIAIASGKGGVGKTTISTNLAIALSMRNKRVCLFDADTSLANVNILLGTSPRYTLEDLLNGNKSISEIIDSGPRGLKIIPAASGVAKYVTLNEIQRKSLLESLQTLEDSFDYLLIDTAAGIDETVQQFIHASHSAFIIISEEPTSLTDAFALIRVLKRNADNRNFYILVNRVLNHKQSIRIFKRFSTAVKKYLNTKVNYVGYIPDDNAIRKAIIVQKPVIVSKPFSPASRNLFALATGIEKYLAPKIPRYSFTDYWRNHATQMSLTSAHPDVGKPAHKKPELKISPIPDLKQLTQTVLSHIKIQKVNEKDVRRCISLLVDAFIDKYDDCPVDPRKMLYTSLEMKDFPAGEIIEIISTLETLHEKRHHQSFRNSNDELIRLLASVSDSEDKYLELARMLEQSYRRRYKKELFTTKDTNNPKKHLKPA